MPHRTGSSAPSVPLDQDPESVARGIYRIDAWGHGYFGVNLEGNVTVRPRRAVEGEVDLLNIVSGLDARGISTPVLLRFTDLLDHRLQEIHQAFDAAIVEAGFEGRHLAVYPIKVNQQEPVVREVYRCGSHLGFGLEVGSKPELLAVLGMTTDAGDRPIICNGFKDDEYIQAAILARKLGRNVLPVVESLPELELIAKHAARYEVAPQFGIRVKLSSAGAGRWSQSAGVRSKFGLTVSELLEAFDGLQVAGTVDGFRLLHCHMGSQIHDIRRIKDGINELAHIYAELVGLGANLAYLDVGGGLGVDYDGTRSSSDSSVNYSLEEYAEDLVYRVKNVCDNAEVPHPTIVTECGRAMVAYHSVLVFDVLGTGSREERDLDPDDLESQLGDDDPQPVHDLLIAHREVAADNLVQTYHDLVQARDEALHLFNLGYLGLRQRALAERLFWSTCTRIRDLCREFDELPEELDELEDDLRDIYFCNFSLFQSLPDSWALRQVFPVIPIHRLDEVPSRLGVLADITCDSDGKIDVFPEAGGVKPTVELHPLVPGETYYLGAFLVGAYQETLGDLHNLFGDTHVVHLKIDEGGNWAIRDVVQGDTVRQVLAYFQYHPEALFEEMRADCERAVQAELLSVDESRSLLDFYRHGLDGYTYLEPEGDL